MLDRMLTNEIEQTLDSFRNLFSEHTGTERRVTNSVDTTESYFVPPMETGWTNEDLNLRVILPAVSQQDVDVTAQGNQIVIRGERKAPEYAGESGFYTALPYGRFERVINLPNGLELDKLQAHLQSGVLDIWIPRNAAMKPRKIQIGVAEQQERLTA